MKRVAILLATYNGGRWLDEQMHSLLAQQGVEVTVFVSDDGSTDDTLAHLQSYEDSRIQLMPATVRYGSASGNFFRLLRDIDVSGFDAVSLSDQDDVWYPDKLQRALELMDARQVDAVSSNVEAFWPDGRARLICKSQPQQRWDHFFEAAGPGCTYVLSRQLVVSLQEVLHKQAATLREVALHDWFIYCYARSHGYRWHIDERPSMAYRQHDGNVVGANQGIAAARARLVLVLSGWSQRQVLMVAKACDREFEPPVRWFREGGLCNTLRILRHAHSMRRYWRDRIVLALVLVFTNRQRHMS